jgi:hypothetical protein
MFRRAGGVLSEAIRRLCVVRSKEFLQPWTSSPVTRRNATCYYSAVVRQACICTRFLPHSSGIFAKQNFIAFISCTRKSMAQHRGSSSYQLPWRKAPQRNMRTVIPGCRQIALMVPRMCPSPRGAHPCTDESSEASGTSVAPTLGRRFYP